MLLLFVCFTAAMVLAVLSYAAWIAADYFAEYRERVLLGLSLLLCCALAGAAAALAVYPFL